MRITDSPPGGVYLPVRFAQGVAMKQFIAFAFVAAAIACAAFAEAGSGISSKQDIVRPKVAQPALAPTPNLPFEVLKPIY
jgi:hypothetical protein